MMLDAFFVALAVFVGVAGHELFGMAMLSRPIVVHRWQDCFWEMCRQDLL